MDTGNKNILLIEGKATTGKSTSLKNLKNQDKKAYLNCDKKELPFKDNFKISQYVTKPTDIIPIIQRLEKAKSIDMIIIDTLTHLISQYEEKFVAYLEDSYDGWKFYKTFYLNFINTIKDGSKDYAILAHVYDLYNEAEKIIETKIPVKGSLSKIGAEADFTTIVSTKRMLINELEEWENDLLHITDAEKEDGFKYVFMTRVDSTCLGEKMRSADGLWNRNEKYIDNDIQQVFARLHEYYK